MKKKILIGAFALLSLLGAKAYFDIYLQLNMAYASTVICFGDNDTVCDKGAFPDGGQYIVYGRNKKILKIEDSF